MVIAAPATMEEGRIMLVGNETDILHSAFNFPINEGGKRYPSADHYAHSQILTQLGLDEIHILTLLATSSVNVSKKARQLLQENMPSGHDMNSLSHYLTVSRQSYTMMGLRLRAEQDKRFRQTLMETGDSLLIVCDRRDAELGIGMDDDAFVQFARRRMANAERISAWMHEERQRPKELGQNQLGFFLMWLRYELREKEKAKWLSTTELKVDGFAGTDQQQEEKPMQISVSDFVLALQGPFQPLSNYYAIIFELKGCIYRSVEHYAYQRLFETLRLSEEEVMKIRTTVKPVDVAKLAKRLFIQLQLDTMRWNTNRLGWIDGDNRTGHAILLETNPEADPKWSCGTDEFEFQHLLTKKYVTPQLLIDWQCERVKLPGSLAHLGNNRVGLALMQLRAKLASTSTHRMPLIEPLSSSVLRSSVSNHMICFSPESVLHPFYPSEIRINETTTFQSAAHMTAQMAIKFFNIKGPDTKWIMEPNDAPECWERLHTVICHQMQLPLEKIQQWYMEERQVSLKEAMKLQFDQNPALMRVLLDTQDALLVSCARFSAPEAELNIGMRERDLRLWLSHVHQDSKQLMDICLRPMALRPPYFGGNRLGFLLMELRREFILAGVFPHQLPEIGQSVDAILGSESPMENYVATAPFDVLDENNFTAIWANPYLLMSKKQLENGTTETLAENWEKAALSKKQAPLLISRDENQIGGIFDRLFMDQTSEHQPILENGHNKNAAMDSTTGLDEMAPEMLRSVYIKMANQFRQKLAEMDDMQRQIGLRSRDSNRLQELRRALERNRENINAVSQWSKRRDQNLMNHQHRGHIPGPNQRNSWADQSSVQTIPSQNQYKFILAPNQGGQNREKSMTANLVQDLVLQSIRMGPSPPPAGRGGPPQIEEQNKTIQLERQSGSNVPNSQGIPPSTQQQSQPSDSSTSNPAPLQQQTSTGGTAAAAEWTQAAAISSGRRLSPPPSSQRSNAPPTMGSGGGGDDFTRPPLMSVGASPQQPQIGQMGGGAGKIPSLFPEFGGNSANIGPTQGHHPHQQQMHLPPPPHFISPPHGRGPLPPQLSTTQPTYGTGGRRGGEPPPYSDRRAPPPPGRFERTGPGRRGNGRRGGGHFGGPYDRSSRSPPSYQSRRRTRTPPPPRHRSPHHQSSRSQQQTSSSGRGTGGSQQRPSSSSAVTPAAPTAPPPVKKPKHVVDESELSEGEILSDED